MIFNEIFEIFYCSFFCSFNCSFYRLTTGRVNLVLLCWHFLNKLYKIKLNYLTINSLLFSLNILELK